MKISGVLLLLIFIYVHGCFTFMCVYMPCVCTVSQEARRYCTAGTEVTDWELNLHPVGDQQC